MTEVSSEYLEELKKNGNRILVDFSANWCAPCRALLPVLESLEKEYEDIKFVKVDVDKNREYVINNNIMSVPTVMIFNGEYLVDTSKGLRSYDYYKSFLDNL